MPFDLIGFSESTPGTGVVNVARGLVDNLYTGGAGDYITIRRLTNIIAVAYAAVSTPGYCRIKTPSMKYYQEFIHSSLIVGMTAKPPVNCLDTRPITVIEGENMEALSANATDECTLIGVWLSDGKFVPYQGPITCKLRGTAAITQTVNTWTGGAVTWSQSLEAGTYSVVGMRAYIFKAATPYLALVRLVGLDGAYRPGTLATAAGSATTLAIIKPEDLMDKWPLMAGISFPHTALPSIETLTSAANTNVQVELSLVKTK